MIRLSNGTRLIETPAELPDWSKARELFLDVETNGEFTYEEYEDEGEETTKYTGLYAFGGDTIAGFAAVVDDEPDPIYVPMRHQGGLFAKYNLPIEAARAWLRDHVEKIPDWINHNIVLDAVFVAHEGIKITQRLICTLTMCKLLDSDKYNHGLDYASRDYLGIDMSPWENRVKAYLKSIGSKNYADCPPDILGEYAGGDIICNRKLYRFLQAELPADLAPAREQEIKLTAGLFDIEMRGLQAQRQECKIQKAEALFKSINLATEIAEITGREFTNSSVCVYDMLINQFGMPVLVTKWDKGVDTGKPTFEKHALATYKSHPMALADPKLGRLCECILEYRKESQYNGLFLSPFMMLMDGNERIHPTYNQMVRTGRMSCKRPNAQQQNKRSKKLIHPRPGYGLISCDYSQIEFRLIVHYIEDQDAILAYQNDPDTDFHQWVADLCGVGRKAGKTLNFGMGYGAGKRKVTTELKGNPDIIADIGVIVNKMIERGELPPEQRNLAFHALCTERAAQVYTTYHERMPGLKITSQEACNAAKFRGFVRNWFGYRRHLPVDRAHIAFNTVIQGGAMALIKEAMLKVMPRYNPWMVEHDIHIVANVHDEVLFEAPLEIYREPWVHEYLVRELTTPSYKFSVPITVGLGISQKHWSEAAGDDAIIKLDSGAEQTVEFKHVPQGSQIVAGKLR